MRATDRKLFRDLLRTKGQVLAISFVVAGGVAMFVLMFGTLQSLEATRDAYYERHRFAQVFSQARRAPQELVHRLAEIPGVQTVETRIVSHATLDIHGLPEPALGRFISLPEYDPPMLNRPAIRQGRTIAPGRPYEALVSEAFADAHNLRPGSSITAIINEKQRAFHIVGIALSPEYIYSMAPGAPFPDDRTFGVFWVARPTLAAAFDLKDSFNAVSLTLLRGASEPAVIAAVDRLLERYGGLGAHGRRDQISHWFLDNELEQLWAMIWIVPPVFLAVAAFLLNISVSRLIEIERQQIGLLKAFGFSNLAVGWHYAKFVLVIAGIGILIGFALGAWLGRGMTELYAQYFRFPFLQYRPSVATFAMSALVTLAAALFGSWSAVRRAIRLPPADAMRPAAPPRYSHGLIERLRLSAWVTQGMRIVLRHIGRWPLRAGLTSLGIASSVALLIGSMFTVGAVDHIIAVQFFQAQRQDTTVTFVEPRSEAAAIQLARLPGVLLAEPFRAVPVRLRVANRHERAAITGLDPGAELFRMLDRRMQPIPVAPDGLMLARAVAERLAIRRGEFVTVEVLEGRRPVVDVRVAAIVEEYIGGSVVMQRTALNRILQEGPVISGAHLRIDSGRSDEFYRRLKSTPAVSAVAAKATMLESFRTQVAENILSMIAVFILFAGIIAFGVVYNSARIMLSERGRELASLRVLGFTRFEIGYILLGELALLTLAALPTGCVLGYGLAALMAATFGSELYRIPLIVDPSTYGFAVIVVLTAAVLSGLVVARRLGRLDLVAVLKVGD
jgi:putative ABC transport system permease protein